jgi:hypothetical protein
MTYTSIALGPTDVIFGTDQGVIGRCAKTGCGPNPTLIWPGEGGQITAIALDARAIYWSTAGGGVGGVHRLAL